MKNYFKVIWRSFAKNAAKLISLTVIMALGIAFVAGLGTLSPTILDSIDAELEASSAPDFIIKSHSALGFTEEQRDEIASLSFVTDTDAVTVADMDDDANTRIYMYSSFDTTLNELEIEGEVPSAAGSTAIAFAGFGLFNVADSESGGSFAGFQDSLRPISVVIIIFALLLCVFVIYNLTNLNIGERQREIATLGVLGYRRGEILGYIYREIMMMACAGALFGVGLGCFLLWAVFGYLEFGSLADVQWYSYIVSFALIILFTGITDLILSPKILGIDMTASLKSVD